MRHGPPSFGPAAPMSDPGMLAIESSDNRRCWLGELRKRCRWREEAMAGRGAGFTMMRSAHCGAAR